MNESRSGEMVVKLESQSTAATLRGTAQENARKSLAFFLEHVVHVPMPVALAEALQGLSPRRLLLIARSVHVWARLQRPRGSVLLTPVPPDPTATEAVRWLFPETKDF